MNTRAPISEPLLLSIPEAAEALRLHKSTIWRLVSAGELPTIRIGHRRLVEPDALRAFISSLKSENPEPTGPTGFIAETVDRGDGNAEL